MDTKTFSEWFSKIEGIEIVRYDADRLYFGIQTENLILKITSCSDASDNFLSIHSEQNGICFCLHNHNLEKFIDIWENKTAINKKLGIPDLSLVTVKQMMDQLKTRDNISFVFVMTEMTDTQNILLEASGNPTYICGLLSRGLNLANKYADKDLDFEKS